MAIKKENIMVYVKVTPELEKRIEEYRRTKTPIPSRSEAIRELVKIGLAHAPA